MLLERRVSGLLTLASCLIPSFHGGGGEERKGYHLQGDYNAEIEQEHHAGGQFLRFRIIGADVLPGNWRPNSDDGNRDGSYAFLAAFFFLDDL